MISSVAFNFDLRRYIEAVFALNNCKARGAVDGGTPEVGSTPHCMPASFLILPPPPSSSLILPPPPSSSLILPPPPSSSLLLPPHYSSETLPHLNHFIYSQQSLRSTQPERHDLHLGDPGARSARCSPSRAPARCRARAAPRSTLRSCATCRRSTAWRRRRSW